MAKKKLGAFSLTERAMDKPTSITSDGKFIYPKEVHEKKSLEFNTLISLDDSLKIKLTEARIKAETEFKLGIIGLGSYSKKEVLENVLNQTELGELVTRAEMNYCDEFNMQLRNPVTRLPVEPVVKVQKTVIPKEIRGIHSAIRPIFRSTALFCEDTTDSLTNLAATYRKAKVHPVFAAQGFNVKVLEGVNDVKYYFHQEAIKRCVVYISGVGHGSPTVYTGHLGDPVLRVGYYDSADVNGKVVHLLSCQTAKTLGPDMITKGAKSYFGYFENFIFNYDQSSTAVNELELFWKCDSEIDICMALGTTCEAAHNAAIAKYNWAIAQVPNTSTAVNLTHDRNYLRDAKIGSAYGSKTKKISKYCIPYAVAVNPIVR